MEYSSKPFPIFDTVNLTAHVESKTILPANADNDLHIALHFLKQHNNKTTFIMYSREIERFLLWAWLIARKSILHLECQDIQQYIQFRDDLPASWIKTNDRNSEPRFIKVEGTRQSNPHWRPFPATKMTQNNKQVKKIDDNKHQLSHLEEVRIFTALNQFYSFLVLEEKMLDNPVRHAWQKRQPAPKQPTKVTIKRLTETQWTYCVTAAKQLAATSSNGNEITLFIITIFYLLYPRPSELLIQNNWAPQMNHFYQDSNQNWWFRVNGSDRIRKIAVSDDMLNALKRYRLSRGLTLLPSPTDSTPLLTRIRGETAITHAWQITEIVQRCFDKAIEMLQKDNLKNEAENMTDATITWLRNTGISDDLNKRGRPIEHVRDDAGHSSSAITKQYIDNEMIARYRLAKNKQDDEKS